MPLYNRFQGELVFYKNGRKANDGRPLMEQAMFMFIKVADDRSFMMPYPMDDITSFQPGANFGTKGNIDIVGIQILDRKTAIPQQQGVAKVGCQFFGDV